MSGLVDLTQRMRLAIVLEVLQTYDWPTQQDIAVQEEPMHVCRVVHFVCCMLPVPRCLSLSACVCEMAASRRQAGALHQQQPPVETAVACHVQPIQALYGTAALAAASVADSVQPYAGGTNSLPLPPSPSLCRSFEREPTHQTLRCSHTLQRLAYGYTGKSKALQPACRVQGAGLRQQPASHGVTWCRSRAACCTKRIKQVTHFLPACVCTQH